MKEYDLANWDDLLADFPLWRIKAVADTVKKPLYNSELHLYHDFYDYGASEFIGRYDYFMSALLGEYATSSLENYLRYIHSLTPKVGVLITENNFYKPGFPNSEKEHPLALLYAYLGTIDVPWRYVIDDDIGDFRLPFLIIWPKGLRVDVAQKIINLPSSVKVLFVKEVPIYDEYGKLLPGKVRASLRERGVVINTLEELFKALPFSKEDGPYGEVIDVPLLWWSPERGHFYFKVPYAKMECKRAKMRDREILVVINVTKEEITAPLPVRKGKVRDW